MKTFPRVRIDLKVLKKNAEILVNLCGRNNIATAGVIKGAGGMVPCAEALCEAGCTEIASSRMAHLKEIKKNMPGITTMLIRIPMPSEIGELLEYTDIALVSEMAVIEKIDEAAARKKKRQKVILMYDLGDLREGIFERADLVRCAKRIERELAHLELVGIGANLSCYGSVIPTKTNLTELAGAAEEIERSIGRTLRYVSGGATTSIPLLLKGEMPEKINHLRLGESLLSTLDLPMLWNCPIEGQSPEAFVLQAEVVEVNAKPTLPVGELGFAAFGKKKEYADRGVRKRAILAVGNMDLGDAARIIPKEPGVQVLGASGDHTILDIEDCGRDYQAGDILEFHLLYQGILFSSLSPLVAKEFIK